MTTVAVCTAQTLVHTTSWQRPGMQRRCSMSCHSVCARLRADILCISRVLSLSLLLSAAVLLLPKCAVTHCTFRSDRKDGGAWRGLDASPGKLVCVFTTKSYLVKSLKTCLRGRAAIWALARLGMVWSRASIQRSTHFCGMPWPPADTRTRRGLTLKHQRLLCRVS